MSVKSFFKENLSVIMYTVGITGMSGVVLASDINPKSDNYLLNNKTLQMVLLGSEALILGAAFTEVAKPKSKHVQAPANTPE